MVSVTRKRIQGNHRRGLRRPGSDASRETLGALGLAFLSVVFIAYAVLGTTDETTPVTPVHASPDTVPGERAVAGGRGDPEHPRLRIASSAADPLRTVPDDANGEAYNAVALDILQVLNCQQLLNTTSSPNDEVVDDASWRRRLEQVTTDSRDEEEEERIESELEDQDDDWHGGLVSNPTGMHLFCLAALDESESNAAIAQVWKSKIHCDATHTKQRALLDLWSTARTELSKIVLEQTLRLVEETERDLLGTNLHLWAPARDSGIDYTLRILNDPDAGSADRGGVLGLDENLGVDKLWVDVGSGLGLTSMAIALLYPGTHIVTVEAAKPNWLLQNMNWECNDFPHQSRRDVLLAGVGPSTHTSLLAKFIWRPTATTSTRSWTPSSERTPDDLELAVKLRPWTQILREADIPRDKIDVLNVDCEGCEYNLIPSLDDADLDNISTIMGNVHWGYIPLAKKPSSSRARLTHQRLCVHENFAALAKECCAFPDLPVVSSVAGEILVHERDNADQASPVFPAKASTVVDVAGPLCDGFDDWARENDLDTVESDWGWFQITSMAEED